MASLNSLEKDGRWVVVLFSPEAPWHCSQKTRTTFTGKNDEDISLCALFCCAKVTDDTAAYANNLFTKNTFTNWRYTTGKDDSLVTHTLSATFAKLCAPALTCVNIYTIMVQSRIRWTMTPTMTAWMTVPHCCIAVTLVFVVSSSQQQQQHTVSQSGSDCSSRQASHTHTHNHSQF